MGSSRKDNRQAGERKRALVETERKRNEEELLRLANYVRLLLDSTDEGIYGIDLQARCTLVNRSGAAMVGYRPEELIGENIHHLIHHSHPDGSPYRVDECPIISAIRMGQGVRVDSDVFWRRDGSSFPVEYSSHPIVQDGIVKGAVVTFIDITERKRVQEALRRARDELEMRVQERTAELARSNEQLRTEIAERKQVEEALRESEERFRSAFEYAVIGMALVAPDGRFLRVNRSLCELVGYSEQELLATTFQAITHPDDVQIDLGYVRRMLAGEIRTYQMEKRYIHKLRHVVWVLLSVSLVYDAQGKPLYFVSQIQDITERRQYEQQLSYLAAHDALTGLPNRRSLEDALKRMVAHARRGVASSLLFLDVDNFKLVNDSLGHAAGDRALVTIACLLQNQLRTEDLLARVGGDEFAVLLEGTDIEDALGIAERMRKTVEDSSVTLDGLRFNLSLSIGLVAIDGQQTVQEALCQADAAMYRAKQLGGNRVLLYQS